MKSTNFLYHVCCFFFQAEDGIRDDLVTGVQTCALPIFPVFHSPNETVHPGKTGTSLRDRDHSAPDHALALILTVSGELLLERRQFGKRRKIGRASCRERV